MSRGAEFVMQKSIVTLKNIVLLLLFGLALAGCSKKTTAGTEATLPELDRALQTVSMAKGKLPEKPEELNEFLALQGKRLPTPPPGKKFVIDPATRTVVLTNQ